MQAIRRGCSAAASLRHPGSTQDPRQERRAAWPRWRRADVPLRLASALGLLASALALWLLASALALWLVCFACGPLAPASAAAAGDSLRTSQALLARLAVEQAELLASDGSPIDEFGCSVALDGNTALVGARYDDLQPGNINQNQGSVYVFVRSGTVWKQQAKLVPSISAERDLFGCSVALDGDTALVGSRGAIFGFHRPGLAYVFVRSGTVWKQQAQLIGSVHSDGDEFGCSVALDGDTALVGAPGDDLWYPGEQGSAYVFVRSGKTWKEMQHLTAADKDINDRFGASVALSGSTAVVGAPRDTLMFNQDLCSAYVFVRSGGLGGPWSQQAQLTGDPNSITLQDHFGLSVAVSGNTALVGSPGADPATNYRGWAYVFVRSGAAWTRQARLFAADGAESFGASVALWGDTALVGAPHQNGQHHDSQGMAYHFTRSGATWTEKHRLFASDASTNAFFGRSVAVSPTTALVGANYGGGWGTPTQDWGSAYVFSLDEPLPKPAITKLKPTSGRRGAVVTVVGSGFGARRGRSFVKFGSAKCHAYTSWTNMSIRCKVPAGAKLGKVPVSVTTDSGASNRKTFKVKR